jgi:DNA-binding transcriptional MerR regulator
VAVIKGDGRAPGSHGETARRARISPPAEQGLLFGEERNAQPETAQPDDVGYRGPTACAAAGITYRQLDYWARTGLVEPTVRAASGSGSQRLYGFRDILALKIVKRLLDTGISLQQIRTAVAYLRERGAGDVAQVTLMSDGASVYACTSPDEVVDLLQGGQGVFGIALGRVWQEVEGTLADLPAEYAENAAPDPGDVADASADASATSPDELARRRARRTGS